MESLIQFIVDSSTYQNLFLFLTFLIVLILTWNKLFHGPKYKLPPGPPPLPLIGNLHQLSRAPPYVAFRDIALKYGPLVYLKLGQVPTVVVSSADIAKEVLVNKDPIFADRPKRLALDILWYNYEDMAFASYSDHWKQLGKLWVSEFLTKEDVRSLRYIREDEITKLTEKIRSNNSETPINVSKLSYEFAGAIACRASLGKLLLNKNITEKIVQWSKQGFLLAGGTYLADLFPSFELLLGYITGLKRKLIKMQKELDIILDDVLNQHKLNHAKGIKGNSATNDENSLDVLLRHKEQNVLDIPISDKHIKAMVFDMFSGGTGTSSATVEWVMSELMRHPEIRAKAQKEVREVCKGKKDINEEDVQRMAYVKVIIKETLRLHPVTPVLVRVCREDCQINGYTIPKNTEMAVNTWGISRDPGYWDDPESFKPERFEHESMSFMGTDLRYFPFGAGRRICAGLDFGVANIEIMVAHLLFHFDWSLPNGMKSEDLDMEEDYGMTMARKSDLNLVPTTYNP